MANDRDRDGDAMANDRDRDAEHRAALRFSARGNTRWIVLRGPAGRAVDRFLVRHLGFSLVTWQYAKARDGRYQPTLLLTTIGARTGRLRARALPYHPVDGRLVVIGSNGGGPKDPDWVWNVRANPAAWARVRRRDHPVRAHVASGEEHRRLFDTIAAYNPSLPRYQERASTFGREVPLVVLDGDLPA
jgi:deazaflavin-dependent oxidoreductase (nitroreductase family)